MTNRAEPVRDDDAGALDEQSLEGLLDLAFGLGIDAGGGLVEDEDGRVFQQCAGNGDALFLADAELDAAFADFGGEAFG